MRRAGTATAVLIILIVFLSCSPGIQYDTSPFEPPEGTVQVSFSVTADMRGYTGDNMLYYRGACERIASGGAGDFMLSPGDIDPPDLVYADIQSYIGSSYAWYPVVGNHEAETPSDMTWLRNFNLNGTALPNIVNSGPTNQTFPSNSAIAKKQCLT